MVRGCGWHSLLIFMSVYVYTLGWAMYHMHTQIWYLWIFVRVFVYVYLFRSVSLSLTHARHVCTGSRNGCKRGSLKETRNRHTIANSNNTLCSQIHKEDNVRHVPAVLWHIYPDPTMRRLRNCGCRDTHILYVHEQKSTTERQFACVSAMVCVCVCKKMEVEREIGFSGDLIKC